MGQEKSGGAKEKVTGETQSSCRLDRGLCWAGGLRAIPRQSQYLGYPSPLISDRLFFLVETQILLSEYVKNTFLFLQNDTIILLNVTFNLIKCKV